MRVRCTARADFRANAVGHLELETTDRGLLVTHLSVAAYREGYAPSPATSGTQVLVPWPSVRATRSGDAELLLSLDEQLTPLSRLALAGFSLSAALELSETRRRRRMVRALCLATAVVALVALRTLLPDAAPHAGAALTLAIAGSAALLILFVGPGRRKLARNLPCSSRRSQPTVQAGPTAAGIR
jgi:hypothetical protein